MPTLTTITTLRRTLLWTALLGALIGSPWATFATTPNLIVEWNHVLQTLFGTGPGRVDIPFSITFPRTGGLPTVTRDFSGFWDLADQQARSRIHGGIHFEFESAASQAACVRVPEFTVARVMRPRR
jgi:hypothetical protein